MVTEFGKKEVAAVGMLLGCIEQKVGKQNRSIIRRFKHDSNI